MNRAHHVTWSTLFRLVEEVAFLSRYASLFHLFSVARIYVFLLQLCTTCTEPLMYILSDGHIALFFLFDRLNFELDNDIRWTGDYSRFTDYDNNCRLFDWSERPQIIAMNEIIKPI